MRKGAKERGWTIATGWSDRYCLNRTGVWARQRRYMTVETSPDYPTLPASARPWSQPDDAAICQSRYPNSGSTIKLNPTGGRHFLAIWDSHAISTTSSLPIGDACQFGPRHQRVNVCAPLLRFGRQSCRVGSGHTSYRTYLGH